MRSLIREFGRMICTLQFWGMVLTVALISVSAFFVGFYFPREEPSTPALPAPQEPLECRPISQAPSKRPPDPFEQEHDRDGLTEAERNEFILKHIPAVLDVRVRVYSKKMGVSFRRGSAVMIDERHALTAEHVTRGYVGSWVGLRRLIKGRRQAGLVRWENVSILRENFEADVALLQIDDPTKLTKFVPITKNWQPTKGDLIWNFGVRTGWSRGRITIPSVTKADRSHTKLHGLVEAKMLSQSGDSGGPVLNAKGELCGLVLRGFHKKQLEYFIHIDDALKAVNYTPPPR